MLPKAAHGREPASRRCIRRARLEEGVTIEPGAVVGREAQIGRGTTIAAGAWSATA